jgi:hypothetical protein
MGEVNTIGLDVAKSIFQVHGVDVGGVVVLRRRVSRVKVLVFFAALPSCLEKAGHVTAPDQWCRNVRPTAPSTRDPKRTWNSAPNYILTADFGDVLCPPGSAVTMD